jgi:hypothetical protein
MKIIIETIDHKDQKYDTIGDYWTDPDGTWQIRVSKMGNWKYEMAVALHELWEKSLCYDRHIGEEFITQFDIEFEKNRKEGNTDEPGDDDSSPYFLEHCAATGIERLFISSVNEKWKKYEETINNI